MWGCPPFDERRILWKVKKGHVNFNRWETFLSPWILAECCTSKSQICPSYFLNKINSICRQLLSIKIMKLSFKQCGRPVADHRESSEPTRKCLRNRSICRQSWRSKIIFAPHARRRVPPFRVRWKVPTGGNSTMGQKSKSDHMACEIGHQSIIIIDRICEIEGWRSDKVSQRVANLFHTRFQVPNVTFGENVLSPVHRSALFHFKSLISHPPGGSANICSSGLYASWSSQ